MKKFKFRLQRVLEYRETLKQEKLREFAGAMHRLRENEQVLLELQDAEAQNVLGDSEMGSAEALLVGLYSRRLQDAIINQRLAIKDAETAVESTKEAYVEANKEVRVLETLKTRKHEQYKEYVAQEEGKFLDELSVQRDKRGRKIKE